MNDTLRFPFVLLDVSPDEADLYSSEFFDLGAGGVEERDATTLVKSAHAEGVTLVASFETEAEAEEALAAMKEALPGANARIEIVVGDAWRDAWKKHFRPFAIAKDLVIKPPWETYEAKPGERILELEPGRAFGTGLHETTSLVAGALTSFQNDLAGQMVLDIGCGSGILAIAAIALGAAGARAIDVDQEAIDVTKENAYRNDMESRVEADTTDMSAITKRYPVVVANIEARVLIPQASNVQKCVTDGGLLVLSGILVPQKNDVIAAYEGNFELLDAPEKGEWIALVFRSVTGGTAPNA